MTGLLKLFDLRGHLRGMHEGMNLLRTHFHLTLAMAKRDLTQRYAGQLIGSIWIVGHPLFLTLLYVFLFAIVFKVKLGGTAELPLDYATYMLSGLVPWLTFQTAINSACVAVTSNTSLVKQFTFPIEVLPVKDVLTALVVWIVGIVTILVYVIATHGIPPITYLLLPVLLGLQLMAMLGIAMLLSAISVFFRDLKDLIQLFTTVNIFLMPIVYVPNMVPAAFRPFLYANPFSYMTWAYQDALFFGRIDHPTAWVVFSTLSIVSFALGFRVFRRLKPLFASTL